MDNLSSNKKDNNKWLTWHVWPDERKIIESFFEICFLVLFLGISLFFYTQFNEVRREQVESQIACLKRLDVDTLKQKGTGKCAKVISCVDLIVPMTKQKDDFIKHPLGRSFIYIRNYGVNDSVPYPQKEWYGAEKWESITQNLLRDYDSICDLKGITKNGSTLIYQKNIFLERDNQLNILFHNPLKKIFGKKSNLSNTTRGEIKTEENKFGAIITDYHETCGDTITTIQYRDYPFDFTNSSVFSGFEESTSGYAPSKKIWFFPKLSVNTTLGYSGLFSLEDISQHYYHIKLKPYRIDSLILKIDFCGATEFSHMNPEPDEKGMSWIAFSNRDKLNMIIAEGLTFHARFKELENTQEMRMFFLTSIISGIVITLMIFGIIAIYRISIIFNLIVKIKKNLFNIFLFIIGLVIYTNLYWFMMFRWESANIYNSNCIAIPLTLFFIYSMVRLKKSEWLRDYLKNIDWKSAIKILSVIFFVVLFVISYYNSVIARQSVDTFLHAKNYNRATSVLYDSIMAKDTMSIRDYKKIRQALLGEDNIISGDFINGVDEIQDFETNLLSVRHGDSIIVIDVEKNKCNTYYMPKQNSLSSKIFDSYLYTNYNYSNGEDQYCLIANVKESKAPVKLVGQFIGTANKGEYVITSSNSFRQYDIYFMYDINQPDIAVKKWHMSHEDFYFTLDDVALTYNKTICKWNQQHEALSEVMSSKGVAPIVIDYRKHIFLSKLGEKKYISSFDGEKSLCDSIELPNNCGYDNIRIYPQICFWNFENLRLCKETLENTNLQFVGYDKRGMYFSDNNSANDANSKKGSDKRKSVKGNNYVNLYSCKEGVYIVTKSKQDSQFVYGHKGLLYKRESSSDKVEADIKDGYFKKVINNRLIIHPISNPSDTCIVVCDVNYIDFKIKNNWMYFIDDKKMYLYNLTNDDVLIDRNTMLSTKQKCNLKKKIRIIKNKLLSN